MIDVIVKNRKEEVKDIISFELVEKDGGKLPPFTAGAHIDIYLKSGLTRQYSICNNPNDANFYKVAILKESASRGGSIEIHDTIKNEDILQISEPRNLFELEPNAKKYLLFAAGIGITPILSMAEYLADKGADFQIHYSAKSKNSASFADQLSSSKLGDFTKFYFSDENNRLDIQKELESIDSDAHIYVCGSNRYIDNILEVYSKLNLPESQIHREFFSSSVEVDESKDAEFEVELKNSGKIYTIPSDRTIFEVLDENGVEITVSCEQGVCGSCMTKVIDGIPEHRDSFLLDSEKKANNIITPCCSRAKSEKLILDL